MRYLIYCLCLIALIGCAEQGQVNINDIYPGVSKEQLKPTLEQIAQTGEYESVLMDLSIGLEREGYMEQAAQIQEFTTLTDPEKIKSLARNVAESLE